MKTTPGLRAARVLYNGGWIQRKDIGRVAEIINEETAILHVVGSLQRALDENDCIGPCHHSWHASAKAALRAAKGEMMVIGEISDGKTRAHIYAKRAKGEPK